MSSTPVPEPVEIHLPTSGGLVRGAQWRVGLNWVGLVHGPGDPKDLDSWGPLPNSLVNAGFSALTVDLPGHGLSEGRYDLEIAAECLEHMLVMMGSTGPSRGFLIVEGEVFAALCRMDEPERIAALVLMSPSGNPEEANTLTACPKLFIHGNADCAVSAHVNSLFRVSRGWAVQSGFGVNEQGTDLLGTTWSGQICQQIVAFLKDYGDWTNQVPGGAE